MDSFVEFQSDFHPSEELLTKINKKEIDVDKGLWKKQKMEQCCPFVRTMHATHARIGQNKQAGILKSIQNINFPSLKLLAMWENQIQSIEGINKTIFPSIQWINLGENRIVSIAAIRKVNWPCLKQIFFHGNFINQMQSLTQIAKFGIKSIGLQWFAKHRQAGTDIRWVVKLETKKLSSLSLQGTDRMQKQNYKATIKKKYSAIAF